MFWLHVSAGPQATNLKPDEDESGVAKRALDR